MRSSLLILLGIAIGVLIAMPFRWQRGASTQEADAGETLAERELDRVVPTVDIEGLNFDAALKEIQKFTTAEITVDWKALNDSGFNRNAPVTIHETDIYLGQILERLTVAGSLSVARDRFPVGYRAYDGRISISTLDHFNLHVSARVYDVHDFVFGDPPTLVGTSGPAKSRSYDETIERIEKVITDNVSPESWRDYGGTIGSICAAGDHLYIRQDWANHRKIQKLLRELRAGEKESVPPIVAKPWSDAHSDWIFPELSEKLEALISKPIERVELDDVPLNEAIDALQKTSGVPLVVKWKALDDAKVSRRSPVSLHMRGMPLSSLFQTLFAHPVNGAFLDFAVMDGFVEITTKDDVDTTVMTRFYDVRDFILQGAPPDRLDVLYYLTEFIFDTVDSDSWTERGGKIGEMREFRGRLLVRQTWSNHQFIAAELEAIRKSGGSFVATKVPGDK